MSNIPIVYTPASNLRKSADMAVGQVCKEGQAGRRARYDQLPAFS